MELKNLRVRSFFGASIDVVGRILLDDSFEVPREADFIGDDHLSSDTPMAWRQCRIVGSRLAEANRGPGGHMTDTTTLLARRNSALGAGAPLFYEHPLHIVRGEGVNL